MESERGSPVKVPSVKNTQGINPENAIIGESANLMVARELDAGREDVLLQNIDHAPRYLGARECSVPEHNSYGENNDKFKNNCAKKKRTRCYICGDFDHEGKRCKKVTGCLICSKKGHLVTNCPNKNVKVDVPSRLCLKCGSTGHDMFSCADNYDSEDLKAIECYICRKVGHLGCVDDKIKGQTKASCYKCGQPGHFGSECTKPNEAGPFCNICKMRGHYKRQCPQKEKAAAKTSWRRSRRARRLAKFDLVRAANAHKVQPNVRWAIVVPP